MLFVLFTYWIIYCSKQVDILVICKFLYGTCVLCIQLLLRTQLMNLEINQGKLQKVSNVARITYLWTYECTNDIFLLMQRLCSALFTNKRALRRFLIIYVKFLNVTNSSTNTSTQRKRERKYIYIHLKY